MDYGIAGRTALVVGGSKGIGLEAARMLAAEGARVAIVARTRKHLAEHEGLHDDDGRRTWMIETAGVPAGRLGEPSEIASTIVYLCSHQSGYLTGHYITVDGGLHRPPSDLPRRDR
jgi:NAD(P)-dependent dehydrogenase (short-subunit alcohol dehydrogenase family)